MSRVPAFDADTLDKAGALDPISIKNRCRNTVCHDLAASSSRNNNQETSYGTPGARRETLITHRRRCLAEKKAGGEQGRVAQIGAPPWGDRWIPRCRDVGTQVSVKIFGTTERPLETSILLRGNQDAQTAP